jgi:hypothetical protein
MNWLSIALSLAFAERSGCIAVGCPATRREFSDRFAFKQAAALPPRIEAFCFFDSQSAFRHQRVARIVSPLLVKGNNIHSTALRDNVTNPSRLRPAGARPTLSARYQPIGQRTVIRQSQRSNCRLVRDELDRRRNSLEVLSSLIKSFLVLCSNA